MDSKTLSLLAARSFRNQMARTMRFAIFGKMRMISRFVDGPEHFL
jgi:hypothetical protein